MAKAFLWDMENIPTFDVSKLPRTSHLEIFHNKTHEKFIAQLMASGLAPKDTVLKQLLTPGMNSQDVSIVLRLGLLMQEGRYEKFFIISGDHGFDFVVKNNPEYANLVKRIINADELGTHRPGRKKKSFLDEVTMDVLEKIHKTDLMHLPMKIGTLKEEIAKLNSRLSEHEVCHVILDLIENRYMMMLGDNILFDLQAVIESHIKSDRKQVEPERSQNKVLELRYGGGSGGVQKSSSKEKNTEERIRSLAAGQRPKRLQELLNYIAAYQHCSQQKAGEHLNKLIEAGAIKISGDGSVTYLTKSNKKVCEKSG